MQVLQNLMIYEYLKEWEENLHCLTSDDKNSQGNGQSDLYFFWDS